MTWVVAIAFTLFALYITNLSTTVYLHRGLAHRGLTFVRPVDLAFRTWLWLWLGIDRLEWVAVHRKHHRFTDVEGDPHSPHVEGGMWRVLFGNYWLYRAEARNPETVRRFTKDLARDGLDRTIFRVWMLGPLLTVGGLTLWLGVLPALAVFLAHSLLYILLSGSINSVCHWLGYRNFDNSATNVRWLALLTAGEGLHNNHHEHPASPRLAMARGEIDPAWWLVRLLVATRLATSRCRTHRVSRRGAFVGDPALPRDAALGVAASAAGSELPGRKGAEAR
jgi:stearoyl-CoA desaturase (delta-9 desaturase)